MKIFQAFLLSLLWLSAGATAFILVKVLKIGPVIYTVSRERGWGVHSGDFLAIIPLLVALTITVLITSRKS